MQSNVIVINSDELKKGELEKIEKLNTDISNGEVELLLDKLDLSAELKALLSSILNFSVKIGEKIFNIGKKIIQTLYYFVKIFSGFSIVFLLSSILAFLLSHIPIIGNWLMKLVLFFAVGKGILEEIKGNVKEKFKMFWEKLKEIWEL